MKKILLLIALCAMACMSCKSEEDKPQPPLGTDYLDLENMWSMYTKSEQVVRESLKGTFVSVNDSIYERLGKIKKYRLMIYKNSTPAGDFTVRCRFYKDTLINIHAYSDWFKTPALALPHYKAMSDEIDLFSQSTFFEYGCDYWAHADHINSSLPCVSFYYDNARSNYFAYINDYIPKFTPNTTKELFGGNEMWNVRIHDILGYPVDSPPLVDTHECTDLCLEVEQDGRARILLLISSQLDLN